MGTSVGSRAITLKQAVIIAAIFEFLGAFLAGGEVTSTIRKEIVDPTIYDDKPTIFVIGMMSCLLAAGFWLLFASRRGWACINNSFNCRSNCRICTYHKRN